jgi:hypothetical protein
LAKVVLTFEDQFDPNNHDRCGVKFTLHNDRSDDPPQLAPLPATPAMLYAMTAARCYQEGVFDSLMKFVCQDLLRQSGLTLPQIEEAEAAGHAAASAPMKRVKIRQRVILEDDKEVVLESELFEAAVIEAGLERFIIHDDTTSAVSSS